MNMAKKTQNIAGGGNMNEVKIGKAVYVVERSFSNAKTVSELIADEIVREYEENASFDEGREPKV